MAQEIFSQTIQFRITPVGREVIEKIAAARGISVSEFARTAVVAQAVKALAAANTNE